LHAVDLYFYQLSVVEVVFKYWLKMGLTGHGNWCGPIPHVGNRNTVTFSILHDSEARTKRTEKRKVENRGIQRKEMVFVRKMRMGDKGGSGGGRRCRACIPRGSLAVYFAAPKADLCQQLSMGAVRGWGGGWHGRSFHALRGARARLHGVMGVSGRVHREERSEEL
jgi:hypothetical protein